MVHPSSAIHWFVWPAVWLAQLTMWSVSTDPRDEEEGHTKTGGTGRRARGAREDRTARSGKIGRPGRLPAFELWRGTAHGVYGPGLEAGAGPKDAGGQRSQKLFGRGWWWCGATVTDVGWSRW